jgi:transcriptional regulator with XRE-family HTH domain
MDWKRIAETLNSELGRQRLSSQDLARKAGVDRKTVDRLRAGQVVRVHTLEWIEQALGHPLSPQEQSSPEVAPMSYGGYRLDMVRDYEGDYLCYRRSFDLPGRAVVSHVGVFWDEAKGRLCFDDYQHNRGPDGEDYEYRFSGDVLIPPGLGVLHFVVRSDDGRLRAMTTTLPRDRGEVVDMKGFLLTLNEISDIGFYPVTSPVLFERDLPGLPAEELAGRIGVLESGAPDYERIAEGLAAVEKKFTPWNLASCPR